MNTIPTTIDLGPLFELRPRALAMADALAAGEPVEHSEFSNLQERVDAARTGIIAQLAALARPVAERHGIIVDEETDLITLIDLLAGFWPVAVEWDRVHAEEQGRRLLVRLVRDRRTAGASRADLLDLVESCRRDVTDEDYDEIVRLVLDLTVDEVPA